VHEHMRERAALRHIHEQTHEPAHEPVPKPAH
jgi:hypothetical protein